ncbi:MAG TPA: tRNA lysidine(34) synthetase TilS [Gammaproteobacteria bacterium]|nr:tRNA lysidine(34) synthetase TilS [Gammaproteobacteria bacterium]
MSGPATQAVVDALETLLFPPSSPAAGRVIVAYSGGVDSTALLLGVAALREGRALDCRAFHFDHRLHPASAAWAAHCRARCAALALPLLLEVAPGAPPAGASIEAWAREQRYAAAARLLAPGDWLLTAHHRDDLAETLLLAALRGSGPHGLAAIAPSRPLGAGLLLRPLLDLPHATLAAAVAEAGVDCLHDPANVDPRHDRSYLRHSVMPLLAARFPAAVAGLARAAALQRATVQLLDAEADAALVALGASATILPLDSLAAFDDARARLVLRRWLKRASGHAPDARVLAHVLRELVRSRHDATPLIAWRSGELRRHRQRLYWLATPALPFTTALVWAPAAPLALPGGVLRARRTRGSGMRASLAAAPLSVRPRRGGERLKPLGRRHGISVKRLLQDAGMPPWQRAQLPLIWAGERLVAVADLALAAEAAASAEEDGIVFEYERV